MVQRKSIATITMLRTVLEQQLTLMIVLKTYWKLTSLGRGLFGEYVFVVNVHENVCINIINCEPV